MATIITMFKFFSLSLKSIFIFLCIFKFMFIFFTFCRDIQDLVDLITSGNGNKIGLEKLRSLMKLMPESDEVKA